MNPYKSRSLHLDAFRVIGAGAAQLVEPLLDEWLEANSRTFVVAEPDPDGELRPVPASARPCCACTAGCSTAARRLGDLAGRVRSKEARLNLLRLTYLLVQTDLALVITVPRAT